MKTTYCGVTFNLITSEKLGERIDEIQDRWGPNWRDDPVKRLVMDTLNDCEHFISHYEDAARARANATTLSAGSLGAGVQPDRTSSLARAFCGIPEDDELARLRKGGAL